MNQVSVHRHARKHDLSEDNIVYAWNNFVRKSYRSEDFVVAIGYDSTGREIGRVASVLQDNDFLIIHAKSPAIASILKELFG